MILEYPSSGDSGEQNPAETKSKKK